MAYLGDDLQSQSLLLYTFFVQGCRWLDDFAVHDQVSQRRAVWKLVRPGEGMKLHTRNMARQHHELRIKVGHDNRSLIKERAAGFP